MWMTKDWTQGDLNAVVKKIGGEKIARGILDGTVKFTVVDKTSNNAEKVLYTLYRHEHQLIGSIRGYELEAHRQIVIGYPARDAFIKYFPNSA